jgi:hypothetical protein
MGGLAETGGCAPKLRGAWFGVNDYPRRDKAMLGKLKMPTSVLKKMASCNMFEAPILNYQISWGK